jgi:hypothetical protein
VRKRRFLSAVLAVTLFSAINCVRARFHEFRDENLQVSRSTLAAGKKIATNVCGRCHLTPLPESMSQDNANYVLAYMGLFLGIDSSKHLDVIERAQFKQRFELLKATDAIPAAAVLDRQQWSDLRTYYLALARYPYVSHEESTALKATAVPIADQGVTMVRALSDGRVAVGGGLTGLLQVYGVDLKPEFSLTLPTPPVHIVEDKDGYYVLTLGSLLGALDDRGNSELYFVERTSHTARLLHGKLPRSAHFLLVETNGDGKKDFLVASFGSVTGGGIFLIESNGRSYIRRKLSEENSIVRLGLLSSKSGSVNFIALAAGARERLLHLTYTSGNTRQTTLTEYPPHLGSVWLEIADLDGDGTDEVLVLSGDNADGGPYNEAKPDQGLRIYHLDSGNLKQQHFESLPGAMSMALLPEQHGYAIAVTRFYTDLAQKQDLTVLRFTSLHKVRRTHFTLTSRPTVLAQVNDRLLIGAGNIPLIAMRDGTIKRRDFSGPALFTVSTKLASAGN